MRVVGIGDGSISDEIDHLEEQLREPLIGEESCKALEASRSVLLWKLADLALENDAQLPGAEDAFQQALTLQNALCALTKSAFEPRVFLDGPLRISATTRF